MAPNVEKQQLDNLIKELGLKVLKPPVRSSNIADCKRCDRYHMYRNRLGLYPTESRPALFIGTVFHLTYEHMLSGKTNTGVMDAVKHVADQTKKDLRKLADPQTGYLPGRVPVENAEQEVDKNMALGLAMACWSLKHAPLSSSDWKIKAIEADTSIEYTTGNLSIPIKIKLDMLTQKRGTKDLWIWDHKTCSVPPVDRASTLTFDIQQALYRLVLSELLKHTESGYTLKGIVHNIIRKPTIRQRRNESFDEYVSRVSDDYDAKAKEAPHSPPMVRSFVEFTGPPDTPEVIAILHRQHKANNRLVSPSTFPRNASACFSWNSCCEYLPLCLTSPRNWRSLISKYKIVDRERESTRVQ